MEGFTNSALAIDNLNEEMYCHAMKAHSAMGDRVGLGRLFRELKQNLLIELEVKPSPVTISLYEKLLKNT